MCIGGGRLSTYCILICFFNQFDYNSKLVLLLNTEHDTRKLQNNDSLDQCNLNRFRLPGRNIPGSSFAILIFPSKIVFILSCFAFSAFSFTGSANLEWASSVLELQLKNFWKYYLSSAFTTTLQSHVFFSHLWKIIGYALWLSLTIPFNVCWKLRKET